MVKKKGHGFTLIELIAVLVIMAIIVLIVTPLVMSIIRKARISADKRSVDAYGRSIELAIAGYLLDTGSFPTSVEQLTIEYSGNEVVCTTTQLNSDSSVYLDGCTVDGRSVEYHYGENKSSAPTYTAYQVGDHVSYNGVTYYVIEDSDATNDTVKLLKENPLTVKEINDLNLDGIIVEGEDNEYGKIEYGSSADYSSSTVKKIVDAWINQNNSDLTEINYNLRLITTDDLELIGYEWYEDRGEQYLRKTSNTFSWAYDSSYTYWTMSAYHSSTGSVWCVGSDNPLGYNGIGYCNLSDNIRVVRPVLELNKSADITKLAS